MSDLVIIPLSLREANCFVKEHHRHHGPVAGCKFAIGCALDGLLIGIAIAGRPVSRKLGDGMTIEVTRLCTDGQPNACSRLYGAAMRVAREMGYTRAITYTQTDEPGTSLRASGWTMDGVTPGRSWNRPNRKRSPRSPPSDKYRWVKCLRSGRNQS